MDNSILIARFLGPFIMLIGISLLFNIKAFRQIAEGFFKDPALVYVAGMMTFVMGLAIVLFHNIWTADWRVIITLFGWITLIKGVWLVALPGTTSGMTQLFMKNIKFVVIPWSIMLVIGIFLSIKGYY